MVDSTQSSRKSSPAPPNPSASYQHATKRFKTGNEVSTPTSSSTTASKPGNAPPNATGSSALDPDTLSDVLLSAGVDLKEEESFLSRSIYGGSSALNRSATSGTGTSGQGGSHLSNDSSSGQRGSISSSVTISGPSKTSGSGDVDDGTLPPILERIYKYQEQNRAAPFLDPGRLQLILSNHAKDSGVTLPTDVKELEAMLYLVSYSCKEWVSDILTNALVLSRHRRRARTGVYSDVSRALRKIANQEKTEEDKRAEKKAQLLAQGEENGLNGENKGSGEGKAKGDNASAGDDHKDGSSKRGKNASAVDEINYSVTNATVNMMTLGGSKRKYSWLTEGASGGGNAGGSGGNRGLGTGLRSDGTARFREVREEQTLVVRDLLGALEHQRAGVHKTLLKGYTKRY